MATLDRVIQMKNEGRSDNEIMAQLQNEGFSPNEVNQAIQQARIKNAITETEPIPSPQGMQPSITEQTQAPQEQPVEYQQQPQYQQPQQQYQQPQQQYQEYDQYQQQNPYYPQTPQSYQDQQGAYYPQESYSTETISEIATQAATEILDEYKEKVGDVASFKTQIQNKVNDIDDRLKKIENSIDRLQQAIIGKIGEYGDTTAMIHHDLENLHGTVAKLMNPLIDNIELMEKHSKKK